jgi:DNA polymerase III delta subunit
VEELLSPSLFSFNKVIVLRHFRLTAENGIAKEIEKCLTSGLAPGQYLVIEANKVDKRLKLAKMIGEAGGLIEEKRPDEKGLRDWVTERFRERGKSIGPGVADLLVDLTGDDLRALASEIEKTAVYAGADTEVSKADLQELVGRSRTERIFELAKHVIQGKSGEAVNVVADLLDAGDSGVRIVGYLGREIRWLIQIHLFLRARPRLWDRGTAFPEFQREVLPAFKAWAETCHIPEGETLLRQKPYAGYMKFKEAEGCGLDRLLEMLDRLVEANKFLVSKSVEHKDRLALEALVTAA